MEVRGIDHIYLSVSQMERAEAFYDAVLGMLGFRKGDRAIAGEPHAHYFNPHLQLTIRPARGDGRHDPYAPGLHHLCLQVPTTGDVDAAQRGLAELGIEASTPRQYPEYNPGYYASFFEDPDGIRLEIVCRTPARDEISQHWDKFTRFLNPVAEWRERNE